MRRARNGRVSAHTYERGYASKWRDIIILPMTKSTPASPGRAACDCAFRAAQRRYFVRVAGTSNPRSHRRPGRSRDDAQITVDRAARLDGSPAFRSSRVDSRRRACARAPQEEVPPQAPVGTQRKYIHPPRRSITLSISLYTAARKRTRARGGGRGVGSCPLRARGAGDRACASR